MWSPIQTKGTAADMNKCTPCTFEPKNQVLTPYVFEARPDQWFPLIAFLSAFMISWPNRRKFPNRWPRVNFGNSQFVRMHNSLLGMLSELRSVVTQRALASYISLDIGHISLLLHSGGDGWSIWHILHSLLTKNAVTQSLIFTPTSYSYQSKELSRLDRQLAVADEGI